MVEAKAVGWLFNAYYVGTLIVLFGNFYYQNYFKKKPRTAKSAASKPAVEGETTAAAEGAKPAKKEAPVYKVWFNGLRIDVGDKWQKMHPGGVKVFKIFDGRDGTDAILATHSDEAIRKIKAMGVVPDIAKEGEIVNVTNAAGEAEEVL